MIDWISATSTGRSRRCSHGCADVQRVTTAVEQLVGADACGPGLREDVGIGVGLQDRLGGCVHRRALPLVAADRRLERVDGITLARARERLLHAHFLLRVDPGDDVGHGALRASSREEQRGKQLRRGGVPEVAVGEPPLARRSSLREPARGPAGAGPRHAAGQGRPARTRQARAAGGVEEPHLPTSARTSIVSRRRSVLTLVASTGPSHSRIAGIARPVVLPACVGPMTSVEWSGSQQTSFRPRRPSVTRRGAGCRRSGGRSWRVVAQRARSPGDGPLTSTCGASESAELPDDSRNPTSSNPGQITGSAETGSDHGLRESRDGSRSTASRFGRGPSTRCPRFCCSLQATRLPLTHETRPVPQHPFAARGDRILESLKA
jgi:hypothetical protein